MGNCGIPMSILSPTINLKGLGKTNNKLWEAWLLGAVLSLMVLVAFLYFWFREKIYLWFLFFQLAVVVGNVITNRQDLFTEYLFPENPQLRAVLIFILDAPRWLILIHFGRLFIDTKTHFPKIDKVLIWWIVIGIINGMLGLSMMYISAEQTKFIIPVLLIFTFLTTISILVALLYLLFSKNKLARFYSAGALVPFLAILVTISVASFQLINEGFNPNYIVNIGLVLTMTLGLTYRFRLISQEKEQAQQEKNLQLQKINAASAKFVPSTFLNFWFLDKSCGLTKFEP